MFNGMLLLLIIMSSSALYGMQRIDYEMNDIEAGNKPIKFEQSSLLNPIQMLQDMGTIVLDKPMHTNAFEKKILKKLHEDPDPQLKQEYDRYRRKRHCLALLALMAINGSAIVLFNFLLDTTEPTF